MHLVKVSSSDWLLARSCSPPEPTRTLQGKRTESNATKRASGIKLTTGASVWARTVCPLPGLLPYQPPLVHVLRCQEPRPERAVAYNELDSLTGP